MRDTMSRVMMEQDIIHILPGSSCVLFVDHDAHTTHKRRWFVYRLRVLSMVKYRHGVASTVGGDLPQMKGGDARGDMDGAIHVLFGDHRRYHSCDSSG